MCCCLNLMFRMSSKENAKRRFEIGLYEFLDRLRSANIHFTLASYREETVMIQISVPGERWEVEFLKDGGAEVERFRSDGRISDRSEIEVLFTKFGESENSASPN